MGYGPLVHRYRCDICIYTYQDLQLHQAKLREYFAGARWYLLQHSMRVPARLESQGSCRNLASSIRPAHTCGFRALFSYITWTIVPSHTQPQTLPHIPIITKPTRLCNSPLLLLSYPWSCLHIQSPQNAARFSMNILPIPAQPHLIQKA
jgi:hypothetical protein